MHALQCMTGTVPAAYPEGGTPRSAPLQNPGATFSLGYASAALSVG